MFATRVHRDGAGHMDRGPILESLISSAHDPAGADHLRLHPASFSLSDSARSFARRFGSVAERPCDRRTHEPNGKTTMITLLLVSGQKRLQVEQARLATEAHKSALFGDFGLTAQLGSVEYSRPRRFRAMLEQWLGQVRAVWPRCPAQICSDGRYLRLSPAKAVLPTTT